jgi:hypothetical protein
MKKFYYWLNWKLAYFCWRETKKDSMFVDGYRYKQLFKKGYTHIPAGCTEHTSSKVWTTMYLYGASTPFPMNLNDSSTKHMIAHLTNTEFDD